MNPKYGDVYRWIDTKYKAMYICPGATPGEGWTGLVLTDDSGQPQAEFIIGKDWIEGGVTEPVGPYKDGWIKDESKR